jgi:putative oxygen-independent coproporphyrinogen III oxidase
VPAGALDEHGVSLYVHLPFCVSKCRYCDFNSYAWTGQDLARHVEALLVEARTRAVGLRPQTVFFGGGTPSFLPAPLLAHLLGELDAITGFRASAREVTLEANPESFDAARAAACRDGGVTRISLGVQSLRAEVLAAYDRVHDAADARRAFDHARAAGFARINCDLIFAFPGQDPRAWREDLLAVMAWGPEHLSCYELSYEPGTALTRLRDAGRWEAEESARCRELFDATAALCAERGYGAYEVSAFARTGEASLHNLAYWRSLEWVGIGAGAASWRAGERRRNLERPDAYEQALARSEDPVGERERPSAATALFDALMMGLRLREEGVLHARLQRQSGLDAPIACAPQWQALHDEGLLETLGDGAATRTRATPHGLRFLDDVLVRLAPDRLEV